MAKYLALTIGPILRTMEATRSTRALWSASYMFSWIMRELIDRTKGGNFLSPYKGLLGEIDPFKDKMQVGLFHDRLILQADSTMVEQFNSTLETVIKELSEKVVKASTEHPPAEIKNYLMDYLQLHVIELESSSNVVFSEISAYLDTIEVQNAFVQKEVEPFLIDFFEYISNGTYNDFITTEFENFDKRFPSTAEIATADLSNNENYIGAVNTLRSSEKSLSEATSEKTKQRRRQLKRQKELDTQIEFYNAIASLSEARQRHKYIAVVQVDGDYMGKFINKINEIDTDSDQVKRFEPFSKQLMFFALAAVEEIKKFGATPIYAGGDDLLFFSPLVGKEGKSFLTLIESLDSIFQNAFLEAEDIQRFVVELEKEKPALSYGVSINYYKFPIGEAHPHAYNLMREAKDKQRDAIFFQVQKHSGQLFGGIFPKKGESFKRMKAIVEGQLNKEVTERFFNSITHKLDIHKAILVGIAQNTQTFGVRLENFFTNNFNEPIHKTKDAIAYLESVRLFIEVTFDKQNTEKSLEKIYAALRLAHFLKSPFKEEEREL